METGHRSRNYEVTVREKTYLWGSADITSAPQTAHHLILLVRNYRVGEDVEIFTETGSGTPSPVAKLHPGDFFAIALDELTGVYGVCALSSPLFCSVTI